MLLFLSEKDSVLLIDAAEDVIKGFWNAYHAYRYDMYVSFLEFLRGNGLYVKKVSSEDLNSCGYKISEINVTLN
jgi:hypothetical protein